MALTLEDLRRELRVFAEDTMRQEMKAVIESMVHELRDAESSGTADTEAQSLPVPQIAAEATHCAVAAATAAGYTELQQTGAGVGTQVRTLSAEGQDEDGRPKEPDGPPSLMTYIIHHQYFEILSATIVILNSLWIGIAADWTARRWNAHVPEYFHTIDDAFCVVAVLEISLRIAEAGSTFLHASGWNIFDTVVVSTQVIDAAMTHLVSHVKSKGGAVMSLFRILKLARILRIARVASHFPQLHVLIRSIADSFANLFWTMILVFAFNYAAAILITHMVSEYKIELGREKLLEESKDMEDLYGNMMRTMVSLFMIISGGISWNDLMLPLSENISPMFKYFFVCLTGFQMFGMMNVITACFVDNALKIAATTELKHMLDSLWAVFGNKDTAGQMMDSELSVTAEDFVNNFGRPEMAKFLEMIHAKQGIDAVEVFAMMDKDGDGSLSINEFVTCCDHIIGPAKGSALASLAKDHSSFAKEQRRMMQQIVESQRQQHDELIRHVLSSKVETNGNGSKSQVN